jgi:hypothetical protein
VKFAKNGTKYIWKQKYNMTASFYRRMKNEIETEIPDFTLDDVSIIHFAGPGIRPWQALFTNEEYKKFEETGFLDYFEMEGYIVDSIYMTFHQQWWECAKTTPVYECLVTHMYEKKCGILLQTIEKMTNCNDYKLGRKIMRTVRMIRRKIMRQG